MNAAAVTTMATTMVTAMMVRTMKRKETTRLSSCRSS
jgi:hypothetical protein